MSRITQVSVNTRANVYFEGKCVSYDLTTTAGEHTSVGVIFPAQLRFTTTAPERMELVAGRCRVKLPGSEAWHSMQAGEHFEIPADSAFDIEVEETLHYICHYG